ncbi:MAG: lipo-like protein [Alphaproteobacteria bacterium]|nr:lipo-like protein [Alphaproteobacteria bacterium]
MALIDNTLDRLGRLIAGRLTARTSGYEPSTPSDPITLRKTLQIGDVLLVEATQKVGTAIKYLTQSTWSHAALYVGELVPPDPETGEWCMLVEANLGHGVVAAPVSNYKTYNTRICRPVGLTRREREAVANFAIARIGMRYDTRNVLDLARYLLPTPPVPVRFRRRMIALGSGEPTRFICSTLIAQAFQSVRYPILPRIERIPGHMMAANNYSRSEILHIRHHSLFTPRDFDISPYFQIVKPTIENGFDHRSLVWEDACHIDSGPALESVRAARKNCDTAEQS